MWKIWKYTPQTAIRKFTNGVFTAIFLMVHGDFIGKIGTGSGNKTEEIKSLLIFMILKPMQ